MGKQKRAAKKSKGKEKKKGECKPDCKWCEKGECWTSGQIEKPEKKGDSKPKVKIGTFGKVQNNKLKQKSIAKKSKGKERKEGECKPDCKWCEKGECWTSGQIEKPEKKADSKPKPKIGIFGKVQNSKLKQKSAA